MPVAMCRESWCVPLWECVMTRRWPCPVVPGRLQARSPVLQISVTVASWRALPERVAVRRPGVPPPDQVSLRSLVDDLLDLAAVEVEFAGYGGRLAPAWCGARTSAPVLALRSVRAVLPAPRS